jgi:hypothetical protein
MNLLNDTVRLLKKMGIEPTIERGKHTKVRFRDRQQRKHLLIVSCTPSSRCALKQNRALLRRILRNPPKRTN